MHYEQGLKGQRAVPKKTPLTLILLLLRRRLIIILIAVGAHIYIRQPARDRQIPLHDHCVTISSLSTHEEQVTPDRARGYNSFIFETWLNGSVHQRDKYHWNIILNYLLLRSSPCLYVTLP